MEPVSIEWLLRNDSEIKTMAGKPSERKGFKVLPKPFEDQGGLGSEIMPRRCMGSIGREITKTICTKTDHLVACAAADLKLSKLTLKLSIPFFSLNDTSL